MDCDELEAASLTELHRRELALSWNAVHAAEAECIERLGTSLTREVVEELERKTSGPDANLTQEKLELWSVAVRLSEPPPPPHIMLEEGEPDPPPTPEERALDEWYEKPISHSLFRPPPLAAASHVTVVRPQPGRRAPRSRRLVRRSRPARAAPRDDDEPEPPLEVLPLERIRRDVDDWRGGDA